MIQENIKQVLRENLYKGLKASLHKGLTTLSVFSALLFYVLPVEASSPITTISAVYFNSASSIVIETEDRNKLELLSTESDTELTKLTIANSKLSNDVPVMLQQGDLEFRLMRAKSDSRSWYKSKDLVEIQITNKSGRALSVELDTILDGLAYQINLSNEEEPKLVESQKIEDLFVISEVETDEVFAPSLQLSKELSIAEKEEEIHQLNASLSDRGLIAFTESKSAAEEFLDSLDVQLDKDQDFVEETFQKIDSTSLTHIGSELETRGNRDDAFRAYNEALQIDPNNLNARLGLARTSTDREEKFQNFLAAIDNQALEEIGKEWHQRGLENHDAQAISKSLVPFQLSVLKNPKSSESRFAYAEVLEASGPDYYAQASKRYLEAAVLAKNEFVNGDENYKSLLRKSTESLIRTLTVIGDQDSAVKYCNSYLGLGFSNFLDGRSIASIIKEIKYNRNPFFES